MKTLCIKTIQTLILVITMTMISSAEATIEKFNADYYTQICKKLVSCASNYNVAETLMLMKVTSVEDCVKKLSSRDSAKAWKASLESKKIDFNPKGIMPCLASIEQLTCQTIAKRVAKPSGIKGCEAVITGSIADFDKCSSHLECSATATECYDTCQPLRLLQCGEKMGEEMCDATQYCDTKKHKCFALKKVGVGEKCNNFSECETKNCSEGTCKDYPEVIEAGKSCGRKFSNVCVMGYWCDDKTSKCVAF